MSVKEHYDNHLGFFYSWMTGDFDEKKNDFREFCRSRKITPEFTRTAIDLGAGNGIQSVALAELDFKVTSVDFNSTLLGELNERRQDLEIEIVDDDIRNVLNYRRKNPELVVCCGDTLSHLGSEKEITEFVRDISATLVPNGKVVFSFRDYSTELVDTDRFIPVKSDTDRILTCHLEYFGKKIRITDLLYEKQGSEWVQKVSSYEKVRITKEMIFSMLQEHGFTIISEDIQRGMISVVGQKMKTFG